MRSYLEIDLSLISHNLREIRRLSDNKEILAMVKADAYGLGAKKIVEHLSKEGVHRFGVSCLEEALDIKPIMKKGDFIHLMGHPLQEEIEEFIKTDVIVGVSSLETLEEMSKKAEKQKKKAHVMLVIDTSMGRLGFSLENLREAYQKAVNLKNIQIESIYTHYPVASDVDSPLTKMQIDFIKSIRHDYKDLIFHTSNSLGIEYLPEFLYDRIRPGLLLYGFSDGVRGSFKIALEFKSRVLLVRRLKKGWNVGYNGTYQLEKDAKIVTIPVGFADGYSLAYSNKAFVSIRGRRYPVVGRISMDYMTVNVFDDEILVGDEVTLMGGEGMSFSEAAALRGSHVYEILSGFSKRVGRLYKEGA